jgi:CDP-glycerol glycerophosphotransferase (TagB/SpsB family)
MALKAVAYINDAEVHHLDHLGVLAATLDIPLITTDLKLYYLGKQFYPDLEVFYIESKDLINQAVCNSFDIIFISNFWDKKEFEICFEAFEKKMRYVYCSHGNSDKGQKYPLLDNFARQDMVLIYGKRMHDFLKEKNVEITKDILCGNYRLEYYKKHQEFYKQLPLFDEKEYQKKVLFAPTWNSLDSCLFQDITELFKNIPQDYLLIFKVHPAFARDHKELYESLKNTSHSYKNVVLLEDYPLIFPLLEQVDMYIGDASSISYDFLYFNKPMFFLRSHPLDSMTFIHQAGNMLDLTANTFNEIKTLLKDNDKFREIRKEIFEYTFTQNVTKKDMWDKIYWLYENSAL